MNEARKNIIIVMPVVEKHPLLEKLDREQEMRDKLEPMIKPRTIFFEKALNWTLLGICVATILFMAEVIRSVVTSTDRILAILIPAGVIMMLGLAAFVALSIAKYLWERKLNKVGLYTPLEFKRKNPRTQSGAFFITRLFGIPFLDNLLGYIWWYFFVGEELH